VNANRTISTKEPTILIVNQMKKTKTIINIRIILDGDITKIV